ncbi:uncharacterized protein LOC142333731 [Lycorma delicatula]|uniref:uncharacterized protein LOC142333731 n=1 Tax=Lycorma delicatula TaxID=130591 RepID=UPI003F50F772
MLTTTDIDVSITLFNILINKWYRLTMLVLIVLNFGLLLPDLMITCSYNYSKLAGKIFPFWIKKEVTFTGTQAICIVISGFLTMPVATLMSLEDLVELITAGSLFCNYIDIIYNIYKNYQPIYYCKDTGSGIEDAKYEMLTTIQDDECDFETGHLSEDSGHSSDTDIDAVVAEFKEKIKVATTMADPIISEPTLYTGRRVTICLTAAIILLIFCGIAINYNFLIVFVLFFIVALIMMSIIYCQPHRQTEQRISICSSMIYLTITSTLLCNFSLHISLTITVWVIFYGIMWCLYNPLSNSFIKQLKQLLQRKRHYLNNFNHQHSTSTLTLVDTIHISR